MNSLSSELSRSLTKIDSSSGIYLILAINGEYYIGSSVNMYKRMKSHINLLSKNKHHNYKLQIEFNKNPHTFEFYCLSKCPEPELFETEQHYFDCFRPSLNISSLSESPRLSRKDIIDKMSGENNAMAKISNEDAMAVVIFRNAGYTIQDIADELDISYSSCVGICSSDKWKDILNQEIPNDYDVMLKNRERFGKEGMLKGALACRKLSDEDLLKVLKLILASEHNLTQIGEMFGISASTVSSIRRLNAYHERTVNLLSEGDYNKIKNIPRRSFTKCR